MELNELLNKEFKNDNDEYEPNQLDYTYKLENINLKDSKILDWNEFDVENWIKNANINSSILNNILPCNGALLYEMLLIILQAPRYFFDSIKLSDFEEKFGIRDYAIFSKELKKLFLK